MLSGGARETSPQGPPAANDVVMIDATRDEQQRRAGGRGCLLSERQTRASSTTRRAAVLGGGRWKVWGRDGIMRKGARADFALLIVLAGARGRPGKVKGSSKMKVGPDCGSLERF